MLKPMMKINKNTGLVNSLDDKDKLLNFLRMEKWIADSPDQAGECFRQFMKDLYQGTNC
jgi:polyhydroxyalkanoate synthase